jgi:hypothetical protein
MIGSEPPRGRSSAGPPRAHGSAPASPPDDRRRATSPTTLRQLHVAEREDDRQRAGSLTILQRFRHADASFRLAEPYDDRQRAASLTILQRFWHAVASFRLAEPYDDRRRAASRAIILSGPARSRGVREGERLDDRRRGRSPAIIAPGRVAQPSKDEAPPLLLARERRDRGLSVADPGVPAVSHARRAELLPLEGAVCAPRFVLERADHRVRVILPCSWLSPGGDRGAGDSRDRHPLPPSRPVLLSAKCGSRRARASACFPGWSSAEPADARRCRD